MKFVESDLPPTKFMLFRFNISDWNRAGEPCTYYDMSEEDEIIGRSLCNSPVHFTDLKAAVKYTREFAANNSDEFDFYELVEVVTDTLIIWGDSEKKYEYEG